MTAPLHQVFICKTHVIPPLNSGDALRKKTSKPRKSRWKCWGRMSRELCFTNACLMFVKSSELGWLAILALKKLDNLLQGILVAADSGLYIAGKTCWGILWWIVISTDWKGINCDLTLVIVSLHNERCRYQAMHLTCGGFYSFQLNISNWDSVFTSRF